MGVTFIILTLDAVLILGFLWDGMLASPRWKLHPRPPILDGTKKALLAFSNNIG